MCKTDCSSSPSGAHVSSSGNAQGVADVMSKGEERIEKAECKEVDVETGEVSEESEEEAVAEGDDELEEAQADEEQKDADGDEEHKVRGVQGRPRARTAKELQALIADLDKKMASVCNASKKNLLLVALELSRKRAVEPKRNTPVVLVQEPDDFDTPELRYLWALLTNGYNVLLMGPPGSGKVCHLAILEPRPCLAL